MPFSSATRTKRTTREKLARLAKNHELVVLLESLAADVSTTLPDAIDQVMLSALFSLHGADGSKGVAQAAERIAAEVQALYQACQRQAADINALRSQVEQLQLALISAEGRLSSAVSRVSAANDETRALVIGV